MVTGTRCDETNQTDQWVVTQRRTSHRVPLLCSCLHAIGRRQGRQGRRR
ncbi:unnamed protein product [Soboliphyme baturini]|uniref:Uncharacterized protein n=1 Tax=Soboliphyme baturini TaxID=241478 RepID=A0A183J8I9_9BILA|nr:unnamed protein product [Soboliphyme baturini]